MQCGFEVLVIRLVINVCDITQELSTQYVSLCIERARAVVYIAKSVASSLVLIMTFRFRQYIYLRDIYCNVDIVRWRIEASHCPDLGVSPRLL